MIQDKLNEKMAELAQIEGKINSVEKVLAEKISALNADVQKQIGADSLKAKQIRTDIESLFNVNREELCGENKSVELAYGKLGVRLSPASLLIPDEAQAIEILKKMKRFDAIIIKESVAKNVVKQDEKLVSKIGAEIVQKENFFLDVTPLEYKGKVKLAV